MYSVSNESLTLEGPQLNACIFMIIKEKREKYG